MKICSKCHILKDSSEFHKESKGKQGLRSDCKICHNNISLIWKQNHPKNQSLYRLSNFLERQQYYKTYLPKKKLNQINRRKTDLQYRILTNLRTRISSILNGKNKSKTTKELLGCSLEFLKQHLESKFTEGMSWSNYGKWEIDHIKPCSKFDLTDPKQQEQCFHYTNLQPLWELDNQRKSNKYKVGI